MILTVIIPTCKRPGHLRDCLECLKPEVQQFDRGEYRVIVSDDDPAESAKAIVAQYHEFAMWIKGPGKGPAANRNKGAQQAKSNWLVFTDDDCLPDANWLRELSARFDFAKVVEGATLPDRPQRSLAEESPINERGGLLWSCNFAIHGSLFKEIGGFDEGFPSPAMEDCDLRERLRERKEDIVFTSAAIVVHPWRRCKGWDYWNEHQKAWLYYLGNHPHLKPRSMARRYAGLLLQYSVHEVLAKIVSFRGRGVHHAIQRSAWLALQSVRYIGRRV